MTVRGHESHTGQSYACIETSDTVMSRGVTMFTGVTTSEWTPIGPVQRGADRRKVVGLPGSGARHLYVDAGNALARR